MFHKIAPLLLLSLLWMEQADAGSPKSKQAAPRYELREGDIVFQSTSDLQGRAVRAATGSKHTHCGVVFKHRDELMVIEAIQPVRITRLSEFIARNPSSFHARRLQHPLKPERVARAHRWASRQVGQPYDIHFRWSDRELYCSEFVWKLFQRAGVELCEPRPFRSYRLDDPVVRRIIRDRYGSFDALPLDEPAVSPGDLATSEHLVEVPRQRAAKKR